jgi:hypothetical protein
MRLNRIFLIATLALLSRASLAGEKITSLTTELTQDYKLDVNFYKKYAITDNILIAASDKVSDHAIVETAYLFHKVMECVKPEIAARVREQKVLCILIGYSEQLSEHPEFHTSKTGKELDLYNWRNRGQLTRRNGRPTVLFAEEDVMELEGGMQIESILIHEFGHVIHGAGFDKELNQRLQDAYTNAKEKKLWNDGYAAQRFKRVTSETPASLYEALVKAFPAQSPELIKKCFDGGDILVNDKPANSSVMVTKKDQVKIVFGGEKQCYAASNKAEYWAEVLQCWFNTNRTMDHDHNHIHTRAQLKEYDPLAAKLCEDVLGDTEWRFVSPRHRAGVAHLKHYDPKKAPAVKKLEHIDLAAQDYYDEYWKTYWKRLYDKYGMAVPAAPK